MATWNTYAEWDEARCLGRISLLQDQISAGATSITGPGSGAAFAAAEKAKMEIWELRCRVAEIRGLPRPPPPPKADLKSRTRVTWMRPAHDMGY